MSEGRGTAPCDWPLAYACTDCVEGDCTVLGGLEVTQRRMIEGMAVELLWSWTNRVFGTCAVAVRPCTVDCVSGPGTYWGRGPYPWTAEFGSAGAWVPFLINGQWYSSSCSCLGSCSCSVEGPRALLLPGPIASVDQVTIDGTVLDPTAYGVSYGRYLIRLDGEVWPACQDLLADPSQPNTFEVQYTKGVAVPVGGQLAAGMLACELAKAYCGNKTCALPQRIRDITREGVTVTMMDSFDDLKKGGTGIWAIDSWTAAVNTPRAYSAVRSVDIRPNRVANQPFRI